MPTSAQDLIELVATYGYDGLSAQGVQECILATIGSGGGGGSGQVTQGSGAPSSPPTDDQQPAIYTDLDDGVIYSWSVPLQVWI